MGHAYVWVRCHHLFCVTWHLSKLSNHMCHPQPISTTIVNWHNMRLLELDNLSMTRFFVDGCNDWQIGASTWMLLWSWYRPTHDNHLLLGSKKWTVKDYDKCTHQSSQMIIWGGKWALNDRRRGVLKNEARSGNREHNEKEGQAMMQVEQVMDDVSRGCIHKKKYSNYRMNQKKFHMVFLKISIQGPKRRQKTCPDGCRHSPPLADFPSMPS